MIHTERIERRGKGFTFIELPGVIAAIDVLMDRVLLRLPVTQFDLSTLLSVISNRKSSWLTVAIAVNL